MTISPKSISGIVFAGAVICDRIRYADQTLFLTSFYKAIVYFNSDTVNAAATCVERNMINIDLPINVIAIRIFNIFILIVENKIILIRFKQN